MSMKSKNIELTVLMPCLNEEETLKACILKAKECIDRNNLSAEILVADNGSTDNSIIIAKENGARVVSIKKKGYGSALIGGTKEAKGKYCIMADSDDSYDFLDLMPYVEKLREGYDLVMGNRFKGGIAEGAMPFLHRYLGTPVLSFLGRALFNNKIGDYNCGMRGYNTKRFVDLHLSSPGMEYASEMIIVSSLNKYKICEVPTKLKKDGRSRKPYLNTWNDGWRHLMFMLIHAPKQVFLLTSVVFALLSIILLFFINQHSIVSSSLFMMFALLSIFLLMLYLFTMVVVSQNNSIPINNKFDLKCLYFVCKNDFMFFIGIFLLLVSLVLLLIVKSQICILLLIVLIFISFAMMFGNIFINIINKRKQE